MHDASKVLLGSVGSSDIEATVFPSDPATFPAGLAVRETSAGVLSVSSGAGQLVGVSLGKCLSDTKRTSVARSGNQIPLQLSNWGYLVKSDLTFAKKTNVAVAIEFLTGGVAGSEVVTVTGDDSAGYLISVSMAGASSTATQLKTAIDASAPALALISTTISGTAGNAQAAFAQDDIDGEPVIGAGVRVSNTTGQAYHTGGTLTGAIYASSVLSGVDPEGLAADIPVALIDMGGGL